MKFRLIFKQSIRDFHHKMLLYISFVIFVLISVGVIFGIFSFNLTMQQNYQGILNASTQVHSRIRPFLFTSVNSDKWNGDLGYADNYVNFRVESEDANFTKYVYHDILEREFTIDEAGHEYRKFSAEEMQTLWNDVGFNWSKNSQGDDILTPNLATYFNFNLINFLGLNRGVVRFNQLEEYQLLLGLTNDDLLQIFNENGEINSSLETNKNYLRYAAFVKINFYTRTNNRWFSSDQEDEFYDHNLAYGSNLTTKYLVEKKFVANQNPNSKFRQLGHQVEIGYSAAVNQIPGIGTYQWNTVDNLNGRTVGEILMPFEEWMDEEYDWTKNQDTFSPQWKGWDHSPKHLRPIGLNGLKIYERLSVDEIKKINPNILKDATYAYVTPLFLKGNNLKLGDEISYFTNNYDSGYETVTIIGTAISRISFYNSDKRTPLFIPFQKILRTKSWSPALSYNAFHFSDLTDFDSFNEANDLVQAYFYDDFAKNLDPNSTYTPFIPYERQWFDLGEADIIFNLFNLVAYAISLLTLILLFVVFYFITEQTIKMQKNMLWFLKSLGEKNFKLSLMSALSGTIPLIVGTALGILLSFGISQMMIDIFVSSFPFAMNPFVLHPLAAIVLIVVVTIIFAMYLFMNWILIAKGSSLSLQNQAKIGLSTKFYIWTKPAYKHFKKPVRIGISFMAKNIYKNILTFILLSVSFSVILFSVQFRSSSYSSATSSERHLAPYRSVLLDKESITESLTLNQKYWMQMIPNFQEKINEPFLKGELAKFEQLSFVNGPITTFKSETPDGKIEYREADNPETVISLTAIHSSEKQMGDQYLNQLMKQQLNEILLAVNEYLQTGNLRNFNRDYDLTQYYLSEDYMVELLSQANQLEHSKAIFAFSETEFINYTTQIMQLIRLAELNNNTKLLPPGTEQEQMQIVQNNFSSVVTKAVETFTEQLAGLRQSIIKVKSGATDLDFGINIYFNRTILDWNQNQPSVFGTDLRHKGRMRVGIGLDNRELKTYNFFVNSLPVLKNNADNFAKKYDYYDPLLSGQKIEVHALDAYISQKFAKNDNLKNNQVIKVTIPSLALDKTAIPNIYIRVVGIVKEEAYFNELYYNKVDLFNYLKLLVKQEVTDQVKASTQSLSEEQEKLVNEILARRTDYQFFSQGLDKMLNSKNEFAKDLFNNSVYSLDDFPFGLKNFTMHSKMGDGYSFLSYTKLPMFNYSSDRYQASTPLKQIYNFPMISNSLMSLLSPINSALFQFIILLSMISLAVGLILISLILFENQKIILLFKSLGYKKREVNFYLTSGYIIATIVGLSIGLGFSYLGINIASKVLATSLNLDLYFVWALPFVLFALGLSVGFIGATVFSTTIYTDKQQPKNAFVDL